jgi:hypothetical protein
MGNIYPQSIELTHTGAAREGAILLARLRYR